MHAHARSGARRFTPRRWLPARPQRWVGRARLARPVSGAAGRAKGAHARPARAAPWCMAAPLPEAPLGASRRCPPCRSGSTCCSGSCGCALCCPGHRFSRSVRSCATTRARGSAALRRVARRNG
eukprot:2288432-Prymnesium_polylepis.1